MKLNHETLIPALKAWVFQGDPSQLTWNILNELRLERIAMPLLGDRVPEAQRELFRLKAKEIGLLDMMQHGELCRVERLFARNSIAFCPIKGADLARRVWPDSALRTRCDLDILVHPKDQHRAIALLKEDGWKAPFQISFEHHGAPMQRHDVALELHSSLHHLDHAKVEEIWGKLQEVSPFHFQFPLELNLLMLFAHSREHRWLNGVQLLLDTGFLIRKEGNPDWTRLQSLANEFGMAVPALLFRAFPDFFPAEAMPEESFSEPALNTFRTVICTAPIGREQKDEAVMSSADRYSFDWWYQRIRGMRPDVIRILTNNPRGNYWRLLVGYWEVFSAKTRAFWRYRHGTADSGIAIRLEQEAEVERLCRTQCEKMRH